MIKNTVQGPKVIKLSTLPLHLEFFYLKEMFFLSTRIFIIVDKNYFFQVYETGKLFIKRNFFFTGRLNFRKNIG